MAVSRTRYVCRSCTAVTPTWTGRCGRCGQWDTVSEVSADAVQRQPTELRALVDIGGSAAVPVPTGLPEVDEVLGGGLVPGSVTLLSGEPGIGKSTLTLQIAASTAATGAGVILVAGEEAPAQVAARADRLGEVPTSLTVLDAIDVDVVVAHLLDHRPQLMVIDSIQTLHASDIDSGPGSATQLRECTTRLLAAAKSASVSLLLIGHVTKDGTIAGPRLLEHLVDTVLTFSGDRQGDLRLLRSLKHRFGPTTGLGVFEMVATGLESVPDPSERFLRDRLVGVPGSVVVPLLDGRRPLLAEVQALAVPRGQGAAPLTAQGLPSGRVRLVAAVLERRAGVRLDQVDGFVSLAGGGRSDDPGADLAVAVALWSTINDIIIPPDVVVYGEIGLAGEVRGCGQVERRLQEAHRLGFRRAIVPAATGDAPTGLRLARCGTVGEALARLQAANPVESAA